MDSTSLLKNSVLITLRESHLLSSPICKLTIGPAESIEGIMGIEETQVCEVGGGIKLVTDESHASHPHRALPDATAEDCVWAFCSGAWQ